MVQPKPLTATKLASYQHFSCDLYIHNVCYDRDSPSQAHSAAAHPLELPKAHFKRGLDWETLLFSWLNESNLLLKVPSIPVEADNLLQNILADERSHFYIAGLTFRPPQLYLDKRFAEEQNKPLVFGLAKPDLLEITKSGNKVIWRVIDCKASKHVQVSHYTQIYFYTLCLAYLFRCDPYQSSDMAGVWLPTLSDNLAAAIPSADGIKAISISLLASSLDTVLFKQLPKVLALPSKEVKWHYSPLCRGCSYEPECKIRALNNGALGSMPNISIDDAKILKDLLRISRASGPHRSTGQLPEIEELHKLLEDSPKFDLLARSSPTVVKKALRILAIPEEVPMIGKAKHSPVVEAARSQEIQVIPHFNYTCPSKEDIAVIISVLNDPSSLRTGGTYFGVTAHSLEASVITLPAFVCSSSDFIAKFANFMRSIESSSGKSCQIYVWSSSEHLSLQSTIVQAALESTIPCDDIGLCIGILAQGASLLQTTFQPIVLSGALLNFLAKGKHKEIEYRVCLERMGLPTEGTISVMRKRIDNEVRRLKKISASSVSHETRRKDLGQLHRIVVLQKEIEKQLALPIPGHWDLPECIRVLSPDAACCPSDEEVFVAYKTAENDKVLEELLTHRNRMIFQSLIAFRACSVGANGASYLINEATTLSTRFLDICKEAHVRKLFFMQQFEVLSKLTELWQSRVSGGPEAPLLEFCNVVQGSNARQEYLFRVVSGIVDTSPSDREFHSFDKLLVRIATRSASDGRDIPVEALFDDLEVSGLVFPLNDYTRGAWIRQDTRVQEEILVADVSTVYPSKDREYTMVALSVWGTFQPVFKAGEMYRLSPRLVDFNTAKVLSALFEIDLLWDLRNKSSLDDKNTHHNIAFLQLIANPTSFGRLPLAGQYVESETEFQTLFSELRDLGNVSAGFLVFKASQYKALQRILSNRLSVIWGPPGTGKTYTISLAVLRLIAVERQHHGPQSKIIFVTATTHAAIEAFRTKIVHLMDTYRTVSPISKSWVDDIQVHIVSRGNNYPPPQRTGVHIYGGTVYQLYNFSKSNSVMIDCLIIDEAGQIPLGSVSLVLRSLSPQGRIIVAGDSEQLAPILNARYPTMKPHVLFGSILDCLMQSKLNRSNATRVSTASLEDTEETSGIVQLTENFRLNADLSDFISTIYSRRFEPQKSQPREFAEALALAKNEADRFLNVFPMEVLVPVQNFLVALAKAILKEKDTNDLMSPARGLTSGTVGSSPDIVLAHHPISLTLIRLQSWSSKPRTIPYEEHVHLEAAVASALVHVLRVCCPNEDIFVATPHRIQREAVKAAIGKVATTRPLEDIFGQMNLGGSPAKSNKVTVDTIERLQGSEASLVICLFSTPKSSRSELNFLLERRRLNVAISRAKTLCILICSDEILGPTLKDLANEATAKGYGFLKAYQERAWSYYLPLQAEKVLKSK